MSIKQFEFVRLKPDQKLEVRDPSYMGELRPMRVYILPKGSVDDKTSYAVEMRDKNGFMFLAQITHEMVENAFKNPVEGENSVLERESHVMWEADDKFGFQAQCEVLYPSKDHARERLRVSVWKGLRREEEIFTPDYPTQFGIDVIDMERSKVIATKLADKIELQEKAGVCKAEEN